MLTPTASAGELISGADTRLYNADLAPTTPAQRTWSTYNYIALWFSMSMEITTYMLASSLIAGGMNWKQAVFTIFLGNMIVLIPMVLNA
ncbi:MAG TPA: cytosine permease, partial [Acidisarcina sp.]